MAARGRHYFEGGVINILIVAKFASRKKVLETLDVLAKLYTGPGSFRVTIVGTVLEVAVYEAVQRRVQCTEYLSMHIAVPHADMQSMFLCHDILILPSVNEVAAVSHLEGMSCGVAVVCSDDNGTADYVTPERTGLIFETESFDDSLGLALRQLLQDRARIVELGGAAIQAVDENHGSAGFLALLASRGVTVPEE